MTHQEFNELMGYTTTTEDFDLANFLYMNAGDMPKQQFVKEFKKIGASPLVKEWYESMSQMSRRIHEDELESSCLRGLHEADMKNIINIMDAHPHSYTPDMYDLVIKRIGHKKAICHKIQNAMELDNMDKEYIAKNLQ